MQDRDLDKIVQQWVDDETASAPKMRPTAEMYERVASLGRKRSLGLFAARYPAWIAALAAVVILVLAWTLVQWSPLVRPAGGQQVAQLPLRSAFASEKGEPRSGPPNKGKGPPGEPAHLKQLEFQIRRTGSPVLRSVDLLAPQPSSVVLTADDSYRLVLAPVTDRYVYVYQQLPGGAIVSLYPNAVYSPVQNPMRADRPVYLPTEPNGFYLKEEEGSVRLYVVAAEEPVPELGTWYGQPGFRLWRRKSPVLVRERLEALVGGQTAGAAAWTFEFEVR